MQMTLTFIFSPRAALSVDKNGLTSNINADTIANAGGIDSLDVEVSKSATIFGQDVKIDAQWENATTKCAPRLVISHTHEKIGDITVSMAKAGNTHVNCDGSAIGQDQVSVKVNLPMNDLTGNDDVSASLEYEARGQNATARLGYNANKLNLRLRSDVNVNSSTMSHKINANYTGVEGINIGLQLDDKAKGHVSVKKDKYEVRVPVTKSGVNANDAQLRMTWSHVL